MENDLNTATEFASRFGTEAACRDYLIQLRWPDGFRCPHCGGRESWRLKNTRFECRRLLAADVGHCRNDFRGHTQAAAALV